MKCCQLANGGVSWLEGKVSGGGAWPWHSVPGSAHSGKTTNWVQLLVWEGIITASEKKHC